nr:tetratricopeptide repeat protein [uncultured Sphingomonas sp.]
MKLTRTAFALAIALGTTALASQPAMAKDKEAQKPADRKYDLSSGARKPISELQVAINAKDTANIAAKLAAAQAAAKTNDDKYIIAKLQLAAAAAANDNAGIATALEAMVNSGSATNDELVPAYINLGKIAYNAKDHAKAASYFDRALKINPNDVDAWVMSAEAQNATGRTAEGVASIRKAIALKTAAGQKPEENWYKRAYAFASNAKTPNATEVGIEWVKAYPSQKNWHDLLRMYQSNNNMDVVAGLDVSRLMYTTNSLASEADYYRLASPLVTKGFPGEAKAVLEQGFAKNAVTKQSASIGPLYASAVAKSAGDRASLDTAAKTALAQPTATKVVVIADAYTGYGDYAKAIDLYKAALAKTGADRDLINLRMGMALAKSGDKAGATAALSSVGGAQAGVAKLWLAYVTTQA